MDAITKKAVSTAICISLLSGCATMTPEDQQVIGAAFGALAGGLTTGLATGNVGYGVAGAVGGAALAWGAVKLVQYNSQQVRTPKQDSQLYGFTPSVNSVVIKLNKSNASPYTVFPGQQVTVVSDYSLALPASQSMIPVQETYTLKKDDKLLFQSPPQTAQRTAGGYAVNAGIPIPSDATPGTYVVESKVQAGSSYDVNQAVFIVK
jgi:uncharacterized protein YcfJ